MKISLRKERLNSQGYTSFGKYFGVGLPLYYWTLDCWKNLNPPLPDPWDGYIRASNRQEAKNFIKSIHPQAKFYR